MVTKMNFVFTRFEVVMVTSIEICDTFKWINQLDAAINPYPANVENMVSF